MNLSIIKSLLATPRSVKKQIQRMYSVFSNNLYDEMTQTDTERLRIRITKLESEKKNLAAKLQEFETKHELLIQSLSSQTQQLHQQFQTLKELSLISQLASTFEKVIAMHVLQYSKEAPELQIFLFKDLFVLPLSTEQKQRITDLLQQMNAKPLFVIRTLATMKKNPQIQTQQQIMDEEAMKMLIVKHFNQQQVMMQIALDMIQTVVSLHGKLELL